MAKAAKSAPTPRFRKYLWPALALLSIALNVSLIGTWLFLLHYNQFPLLQAEVSVRCNQPGYTRFMHQVGAIANANAADLNMSKKFAAASLCFTDYDTGKPIDLGSIHPAPGSTADLPAKP